MILRLLYSQGDKIWTCDLYIPNVALYQAEPRLDDFSILLCFLYSVNTFFPFFYGLHHWCTRLPPKDGFAAAKGFSSLMQKHRFSFPLSHSRKNKKDLYPLENNGKKRYSTVSKKNLSPPLFFSEKVSDINPFSWLYKCWLFLKKQHYFAVTAMISTSHSTFFGSVFTATQERAGLLVKYLP